MSTDGTYHAPYVPLVVEMNAETRDYTVRHSYFARVTSGAIVINAPVYTINSKFVIQHGKRVKYGTYSESEFILEKLKYPHLEKHV